jgi:predicted phosphoribosyltransferase
MFFNRYDAGHQLSQKLRKYSKTEAVVYAIPPGGVLTGFVVAKDLQLPLELIISHRVPHPLNQQASACVVTEQGERVCDEIGVCGVDSKWIEYTASIEHGNILRERLNYMKDNQVVSTCGKIAIIIDDGIVSGLTLRAAISTIRHQNPKKIIVASTITSHRVASELRSLADEVVLLKESNLPVRPVNSYYANFPTVYTRDVRQCLERSKVSRNKALLADYQANLLAI